jgi:hypothetical protein
MTESKWRSVVIGAAILLLIGLLGIAVLYQEIQRIENPAEAFPGIMAEVIIDIVILQIGGSVLAAYINYKMKRSKQKWAIIN